MKFKLLLVLVILVTSVYCAYGGIYLGLVPYFSASGGGVTVTLFTFEDGVGVDFKDTGGITFKDY